jgi:hypothetical protein
MKYRPWCPSQRSGRDSKAGLLDATVSSGDAAGNAQPARSTTRWGAIGPAVAVMVAPSLDRRPPAPDGRGAAMVGLSDARSAARPGCVFVLPQGFDQCEQRLRSGGQFGVVLSCPPGTNAITAVYPGRRGLWPQHRVRCRSPRVSSRRSCFPPVGLPNWPPCLLSLPAR